MPDDLPRKGPDYDDDFYAWTQHQAQVLRSMPVRDNRFDREHVAEEIEDLGKSERDLISKSVAASAIKSAVSPTGNSLRLFTLAIYSSVTCASAISLMRSLRFCGTSFRYPTR